MIEAIFLKKGRKLKVFILSFNGETEVKLFFDESKSIRDMQGQFRAFRAIINYICELGLESLTPKAVQCWPLQRELFCELKKGPHRTVEQAEYDRALRLKRSFDVAPAWRE